MLNKLDKILLNDNTTQNFYEAYKDEKFKKWLLNILPEVEDCRTLAQDNPWHIYNCLDHILHAVEEINKQTKNLNDNTRKMLAYTMFLHDIGKPQCVVRRFSKLYNREVDSFFDHNKASAKIAGRVLGDFGFNKNERDIIQALVEDHDIFMYITLTDDHNRFHKVLTQDLLFEHVSRLDKHGDGKILMQYLTMVGKADNMAQNPQMTQNSLKLINTMQDMIQNIPSIEGELIELKKQNKKE
ncbi:MAG: HD domain-containing protein [Clostridia bacterium]|nr:HD domain-containing protein [Clostridia bacterium]